MTGRPSLLDTLPTNGSDTGWHAGSRVLLVEDSRAIASVLQASLSTLDGIECDLARSLAEAEAALNARAGDYFVAVVGLNLPDAPHGEVVETVQRAGLRVIVLTGHLDETRRRQMFDRGVADYVVKDSLASIEHVNRLVERMARTRDVQILVVDDSASFRHYLANLLQQHGYRTLTAGDGREGLAILDANPGIQLVLTDYVMPHMDGLAMILEMRKRRNPDELAIIGLSESTKPGILARFLKGGASDYVKKPFCVEEFYCRVDQNIDMLGAIRKARDAANRDFLTQLYNRRYFFEHAETLYRQAVEGTAQILIAMIDADRFKQINDGFGHQTGDEALVAIAGALRRLSGGEGLVARFGGEEFALLRLLGGGQDPADSLEAIRRGVEQIELHCDGRRVAISVSIGATRELGSSLDHMLATADRAVYQAKQQGRNRVVIL